MDFPSVTFLARSGQLVARETADQRSLLGRRAATSRSDMGSKQGKVGRRKPVARRPRLVPVRIDQGWRADEVESLALLDGELDVHAAEIDGELVLVARTDDERRDGRPPEEPGEGELCGGDPAAVGDFDE